MRGKSRLEGQSRLAQGGREAGGQPGRYGGEELELDLEQSI